MSTKQDKQFDRWIKILHLLIAVEFLLVGVYAYVVLTK